MSGVNFPKFFDAKELGNSFKEVSSDLLRTTHQDVDSRWFHSSSDADLFIWTDQKKSVIKLQISFYGQVVEWNIVEGVRTGLLVEEEDKARIKGVEMIRFDEQPLLAPIQQAVDLLHHITALSEFERHAFARNFTKSSRTPYVDQDEFVKRLGPTSTPLAHVLPWWQRFFRWLGWKA